MGLSQANRDQANIELRKDSVEMGSTGNASLWYDKPQSTLNAYRFSKQSSRKTLLPRLCLRVFACVCANFRELLLFRIGN